MTEDFKRSWKKFLNFMARVFISFIQTRRAEELGFRDSPAAMEMRLLHWIRFGKVTKSLRFMTLFFALGGSVDRWQVFPSSRRSIGLQLAADENGPARSPYLRRMAQSRRPRELDFR